MRWDAGADDTQTGQSIHPNFSSAYEVIPNKLHGGFIWL